MPDPRVICVIGMHRSGTSAVSRILYLLGWSLGPAEKLMPPAEFNPTGHWEFQPFVDINDEILATLGGSWDRPPEFPDGWHRSAPMVPLQARVRRLLETDFSRGLEWAWKDPRTCLTLPFWQEILPPMGYVVCLRNPLDVALSLQRRDGFSLVKGGDLWLTYVASSFLHTSALPRIFLYYEDLLRDWKPEVRRLAEFLGDPRAPEREETESSIEEFVDRSLGHYRSLPEQALSEGAIPYSARALYAMLQSHSAGQREEANRVQGEAQKSDRLMDQFVKMALQADKGIDQNRQLEESEHQAETIRTNLAESQRQLAGLQANLTESQAQVGALRANLAERDMAFAEMEDSLTAIRQSRSWRLTGPLRWLGGRLHWLIDRR